MRRLLVGAVSLVAAAVLTVADPGSAHAAPVVDTMFPKGLPWAEYEDACVPGVKRCVWHAPSRGWGDGRSFILTFHKSIDEYVPTYIGHRRAGRLAQAFCDRPYVQDCDVY